jgi:hypothetical protein
MDKFDIVRKAAEDSLEVFIGLVAPTRALSSCHREVIDWWERPDAKSHQLLLYPRDHMKSALIGFRVAQSLAKDPTLRILYISSTSNLAEKQLGFIKGILTSKTFQRYWPNHLHREEGKREKWTNTEISLDHPDREKWNIRDPSVFTAGLTTNLVGLHCDIAVMDDIVTGDNADTNEGRNKVKRQYSLLSSIEGADCKEWSVGTRYNPSDLYGEMMDMHQEVYDEDGKMVSEAPVYEVMQRSVEDVGDGSGEYLWPRTKSKDGKWFGFDIHVYALKKAKYLDKAQFRAQYYNDPNDPDNQPIDFQRFQYFDRGLVRQQGGVWMYKGKRLNLVAAIDFAFSVRKSADYTCIVVIGCDSDGNIYILDIERFKTPHISEYFDKILYLHQKWGFKKLRAEVNAAQESIVKSLKKDYVVPHNLALKVEEVRSRGNKEERIEAVLHPRYELDQVFHYRGGNCAVLEDELVSSRPPHDDVKDTLATAVEGSVKPRQTLAVQQKNVVQFHSRFGGRAH